MEQKNWARVRDLVGYYRYDTTAELAKLNEISALEAQITNYFLPQQKLVSKVRDGAKVTKRHDVATTPHRRAIRHEDVRNARGPRCSPPTTHEAAALSRQIHALTAELESSLSQEGTPLQTTGHHRLERPRLAKALK